jgi:hypothetical protein
MGTYELDASGLGLGSVAIFCDLLVTAWDDR